MVYETQKQIELFKEFIEDNYKSELHRVVNEGKQSLVLDFSELAKFDFELAEQLLDQPEELLKACEIAIDQIEIATGKKIKPRFFNLPTSQEVSIRNLRSVHLGKFLSIVGVVRQASDVRPQVTSARFECPACGNIISVLQLENVFREPARCTCGRKGRFRLLSKELVDAQRLVIEEVPEMLEGGEQPKRISVFLKGDLVEPKMEKRTTPGNKVGIYGIVKEVPIMLKGGVHSTRYDLAVEANYIEPLEESFEEIEITPEDEAKIQELAKDPKIYEKLVKTIAPSIYGHEDIKLALAFQLFGGVKKQRPDGTRTRGDIHILLVGDPGSGKSMLLKFIANVAPKGRYVSGKGASTAGLTASVLRDEFLKGWALEAGAIVLANQGVAALDELDKLSQEDTAALHEAMELQTITISKANIQATLRAETTILAAANPKFGRFDPYQPIAAQIAMPPTLINRFDLIFPVRDLPSKDKDDAIATHILELQRKPQDIKHEIPLDLLKKYISYARQKAHPILTEAALKEIKDFYVNLRNMEISSDTGIKPIPITARQLEALVRLAEASAKVRLSQTVTKADAKRAINILKHCLIAVGFDYETKTFDIDRISTGIPASQRSKIVIVREIIDDFTNSGIKSIPIDEIVAEAAEKGIREDQVEEIIDKLKKEGIIFEPKRGFIQKI